MAEPQTQIRWPHHLRAERRRDEDPRHKWSPVDGHHTDEAWGPDWGVTGGCYRCGRGYIELLVEWQAERRDAEGRVLPQYTMQMFMGSTCDGERRAGRA